MPNNEQSDQIRLKSKLYFCMWRIYEKKKEKNYI